jgi:hypothetical protein
MVGDIPDGFTVVKEVVASRVCSKARFPGACNREPIL